MTMTESTLDLHSPIKEEDDADFFIMCKNPSNEISKPAKESASDSEIELNVTESSGESEIKLNTEAPTSTPSTAPVVPVQLNSIPTGCNTGVQQTAAIAAAIQAVAAAAPQLNPADGRRITLSLPLFSPMMSAFTICLPNNSDSTNNPGNPGKFIVVPVHQCWGCEREFTNIEQFHEHVTKSMCLPALDTKSSTGESVQLPSDTSASMSDQVPENSSAPVISSSSPEDIKVKVEQPEATRSNQTKTSIDLVIESVIEDVRKSIRSKESSGISEKPVEPKEEPMDIDEMKVSQVDANDTNNNKQNEVIAPKVEKVLSIDESMVEEDVDLGDLLDIDPQHPARLKKAIYSCYECDKEFHTNIGLLRHQSIAHGAKQFPCEKPGCSKVFKNESALADHNKRVHGPRSFACVHCNAYFTTETYLKAHVKIHMEKKHVCKECKHSFVNKTDLNNHMRVHTGVKPYCCKVCGKAFRHVSGYYTHVRIHTGETPYQCEFCDKKFTNASNFQTHRKIHTQDKKFKCDLCGKEFIQQSNFTRHKRTHTKERPYKCNDCGEEFSYSTCLKKHLKKDHGVEPLECDRCKRTFLNHSSFIRHRTGCQFKDIVKKEAETDSAQFL